MPLLLDNLAMAEGDWPGSTDWFREGGAGQLAGPRRGGAHGTDAPTRLAKFHAPEIVFGPGALAELGHCAARLGARRPFLVTDPGLIEAGWVEEAVAYLRQGGLRPAVWHDVTPNPKDHEIEAAFQRYVESGSDVIIGLGGGSCIDAAKGVAILSGNGGRILGYEGVDKVVHPIPPTMMVPSTSGTGADVSQFAVITDTAARVKITIISRTLEPEISVIDPRLLTTMPEWLNAATGLDALTHAIEAFVSRAHNPLTDSHALLAVELITRHLLAHPAAAEGNQPAPGHGPGVAGGGYRVHQCHPGCHARDEPPGRRAVGRPARGGEWCPVAPRHQVQRPGRAAAVRSAGRGQRHQHRGRAGR